MKAASLKITLLILLLLLLPQMGHGKANNSKNKENYSLINLGTLGGTDSFAYSINDKNQIVGSSRTLPYNESEAFLYEHGSMRSLAPLNTGSLLTVGPMDINNSGQVASGVIVDGIYFPAIYDTKSDDIRVLGSFGGFFWDTFTGVAMSINNRGQAAGYSYLDSHNRHAFFWSTKEGMVDLGSFGGYSQAYSLNDHGIIAGTSSNTISGYAAATIWVNGKILDISAGAESHAAAVNNRNEVVGEYLTENGFNAFLYKVHSDEFFDLGFQGYPYSINNKGQIVGVMEIVVGTEEYCDWICTDWEEFCWQEEWCDWYCVGDWEWICEEVDVYGPTAFLYEDGILYNLNDLVDEPDFLLEWAFDINNKGCIVGYGTINDQFKAFLLEPSKQKKKQSKR
jgi:probable HAF family extracellular repeat protein